MVRPCLLDIMTLYSAPSSQSNEGSLFVDPLREHANFCSIRLEPCTHEVFEGTFRARTVCDEVVTDDFVLRNAGGKK